MATAVAQENSPKPGRCASDSDLNPPDPEPEQTFKEQLVTMVTKAKDSLNRENLEAFIRWLPSVSRNWLLGASVFMCLAVLFLPCVCDETYLPTFLTLAVHHKIIAAYILGLLTAVILKS